MVATSVACAGVGIAYAAMPALILDNVPKHEASSSVGVNALMHFIGTTVSGAVMAIVTNHEAFQLGFLIAAGAAFAAVVLTLLVPKKNQYSLRYLNSRSPWTRNPTLVPTPWITGITVDQVHRRNTWQHNCVVQDAF